MTRITPEELQNILDNIYSDRESIIRNNPIGSPEEILLWMLLSSLIFYLNLSELETPCFTGKPDARTYRAAIEFVLKDRLSGELDIRSLLDRLLSAV